MDARQPKLKTAGGVAMSHFSTLRYTETMRHVEHTAQESPGPGAKSESRRGLRLMDGMIGEHCGDRLQNRELKKA